MDHPQLKAIAAAVFGFAPDWTHPLCNDIIKRIDELGVPAAAFFRTVAENKKVPGRSLKQRGVILSGKWDQFVPDELQFMKTEAKVKFDSDLVAFRNAMRIHKGNRRGALEDPYTDMSGLGRNRISVLYGYDDVAASCKDKAMIDGWFNPFLAELYDNLQEDDNG